jgi:hypothetical protein
MAINASPGEKMLNKAGIAIKSENKGINTQVRFKKKPKFILERYASSKHNAYKHNKIRIFFVRITCVMNSKKVTAFIRGSNDCNNPVLKAYSSAKIDSFKKDKALKIERSIKLLLFLSTF